MGETTGFEDGLRTIGNVLLWCFVFSMVMLALWFGMIAIAAGPIHRLHGCFYEGLTRSHFALVHYAGMAGLKVAAIMLFGFPYVAIRIVLRKKSA
ncbi:MAG: DUF6868 family protein [Planctomycetota bacterium]|jgi:hypothetical protein